MDFVGFLPMIRPGKVDLQFIVKAFSKMHAGGRSFFIFSFGPVHVATETIQLSFFTTDIMDHAMRMAVVIYYTALARSMYISIIL